MPAEYSSALATLRAILRNEGVRPAVIYLNGLTQHRFTSLYRFDRGDRLENLCFYDRENPAAQTTATIPVTASYCVFVRDQERPFFTSDSLRDERLAQHPKQHVIRSYCGVPLVGEDGTAVGSVCHFDLLPRAISPQNVELLEAMTTVLNEWYAQGQSEALEEP
jgi:GAF domain-containing protein